MQTRGGGRAPAPGTVEQLDDLPGLAPGQAVAGKAAHITEAGSPDAGEEFWGGRIEPAAVGQGCEGQGVDCCIQSRSFAYQAARRKAGQPAGRQGCGGQRQAASKAELIKAAEDCLAEGRQATEQAQAGLDLQQHGGGIQADRRGEACGPAGDLDQRGVLQARVALDQPQARCQG